MPRQISVDELARLLATPEPPTLLDVREAWEHDTAALPGTLLIPLHELEKRWPEVEGSVKGGNLIVVYCHHGVRSLSGAAILEAHQVGPVASLAGGIDAWSRVIDPAIPRY